uniref:AlNc14C475G11853 protein n=1 Tax=Albugo laibachii Nc14 TaxID=890382 RepID=F0X0B6_9STRA|nr:AlNc14C475G11853 [Albugo laibachii Nc14]|eukprot:CCA27199.1 AlNc14C475G11853 [Albugo laibachii Nc14]
MGCEYPPIEVIKRINLQWQRLKPLTRWCDDSDLQMTAPTCHSTHLISYKEAK